MPAPQYSFLALTFCYFARVITRNNSRFSRRIYASRVTAIASLTFLVNTAIGLKSHGETPSGIYYVWFDKPQNLQILVLMDISLLDPLS